MCLPQWGNTWSPKGRGSGDTGHRAERMLRDAFKGAAEAFGEAPSSMQKDGSVLSPKNPQTEMYLDCSRYGWDCKRSREDEERGREKQCLWLALATGRLESLTFLTLEG